MKRFTATEKWINPWYMKLSADHKIAWSYILDNCDSAGVWDRNEELASFQIGSQVNWAEFRKALDKRIQELPNGKWWVLGFIEFQYGELKPTAGVHRAVIDRLKRHGLWDRYVMEMGLKSHQEEVQAKEEEKDQGGECKGEDAEHPSLDEVKAYAHTIGLVEWKAVDFYEKHETTGWMERGERMKRWQNAMNRTKTYWEAEGKPMKPPTAKFATKTEPEKIGPTLKEVKDYLIPKGDEHGKYSCSFHAYWSSKNWKRRDGSAIDWKARASEDWARHRPETTAKAK